MAHPHPYAIMIEYIIIYKIKRKEEPSGQRREESFVHFAKQRSTTSSFHNSRQGAILAQVSIYSKRKRKTDTTSLLEETYSNPLDWTSSIQAKKLLARYFDSDTEDGILEQKIDREFLDGKEFQHRQILCSHQDP